MEARRFTLFMWGLFVRCLSPLRGVPQNRLLNQAQSRVLSLLLSLMLIQVASPLSVAQAAGETQQALANRAMRYERQVEFLVRQERPFSAAQQAMEADKLWERYFALAGGRSTLSRQQLSVLAVARADLLLQLGLPAAAEAQLRMLEKRAGLRDSGALVYPAATRTRIHLTQHRLSEALAEIERGERLLQGIVRPVERAELLALQLETLLAMGRTAEALALFRAYGRPAPDQSWTLPLVMAARAHVLRGERVAARTLIERHQADIDRAPDLRTRLEARLLLLELYLELGQAAEAAHWLSALETLAAGIETPVWRVRLTLAKVRLQQQQGQQAAALETLRSSLNWLQKVTERQREDGSLAALLLPLAGRVVSSETLAQPLRASFLLLTSELIDVLVTAGKLEEAEGLLKPYLQSIRPAQPGGSTLRLLTQALRISLLRAPVKAPSGLGARAEQLEIWLSQFPASALRRMEALEVLAEFQFIQGQKSKAAALLEEALAHETREVSQTPGSSQERAMRAATFARLREQLFSLKVDAGQWPEALAVIETTRSAIHLEGVTAQAALQVTAHETETLRRLALEMQHIAQTLEQAEGKRAAEANVQETTAQRGMSVVPRQPRKSTPSNQTSATQTSTALPTGDAREDTRDGSSEDEQTRLVRRWRECARAREALLATIRSRQSGDARDLVREALVRPLSPQALRSLARSFEPGELVMGWTVGVARVWGWTLSSRGVEGVVLDISPQRLEASIERLNQLLWPGSPGELSVVREEARRLWKVLVGPLLRDGLPMSRLTLIPEGILEKVSFAAMPVGSDGWLGLSLPLAQTTGLSVLKVERARVSADWLQAVQAARASALVVADPRSSAAPLPLADEEGRLVAAQLGPRAQLLVGEEALEARVWELLPLVEVALFATHGTVVPFEPRESYLRLASPGPLDEAKARMTAGATHLGPAETDWDGRLTVGELLARPLQAHLIVLSGCSTGETAPLYQPARQGSAALRLVPAPVTGVPPDSPTGGAVGKLTLGLAQGFKAAGAEQVVGTLWPIEDHTSQRYSQAFFQALVGGATPSQAVQQARETLVRENVTVLNRRGEAVGSSSHPAYWAPYFVLGTDGQGLSDTGDAGTRLVASTGHSSMQQGKEQPASITEARAAPRDAMHYPTLAYTAQGLLTGSLVGGLGGGTGLTSSLGFAIDLQYGLLHVGGTGNALMSEGSATNAFLDLSLGLGHAWGRWNPALDAVVRNVRGEEDWSLGVSGSVRHWFSNGLGGMVRITTMPGVFFSQNTLLGPGVQVEVGVSGAAQALGHYRPLFEPPSLLRALFLSHFVSDRLSTEER